MLALLVAGTIGTLDRQLPPAQADPVAPQVQTPADVVVVTASRREEKLRNAPATMTVVTDATIREVSGETMADFLRQVPGVNVSQTAARDVNVTPRAATGTLSDSLLVLLDGRSIYQDFFGSVLVGFRADRVRGDQAD